MNVVAGATYELVESVGRGKSKVERVANRLFVHISQQDAFDPEHDTITVEYRPSGCLRHMKAQQAEKMLSKWRLAK
jgi:hypothetical protein